MKKQGISLIVLVITIIVMIILAAAVIISLENTGVIGAAENAVCKTNIKQAQNLAVLTWSNIYTNPDEYTMDNVEYKLREEFEANGLNYEDYNVEVTKNGINVSSKAGCTDSSGVEGGNGGSDVVATNWEVAYAYDKASNTWTEYNVNEGTEPVGDVVAKLYKTGDTVIPSYTEFQHYPLEDEIVTYPEGDAYKMVVTGSGEMPDLGIENADGGLESLIGWQTGLFTFMTGQSSELPKTMYVTEVEIDEKINTIGYGAFFYFISLENIEFSNNLTRIESNAFYSCQKLNIIIPDTVLYVGEYAFCEARLNMSVTPSNLITVGERAFDSCILVNDTLTIASTVKIIEKGAFSNIENLVTLNILSAEVICEKAFEICYSSIKEENDNLKTVIFPENIKEVKENAFRQRALIKNVYYRGTEEQWGNIIFDRSEDSNINSSSIRTYEYKD